MEEVTEYQEEKEPNNPIAEDGYTSAEKKLLVYMANLVLSTNDQEVFLPPIPELRESLEIGKQTLMDALNMMEQKEYIEKNGAGRGSKTFVKMGVRDAYVILKKYVPSDLAKYE
jgi:DNA-binding MarR family transcriptional regulator